MSEVATKVCRRGRAAPANASHARKMSCSVVRQSAAIAAVRHTPAMASTAAKSPSDAMGKPPSITSTPSRSSWRAMRTFSSKFIEQPGDCSPSRKVVSKIVMRSVGIVSPSLLRSGKSYGLPTKESKL